MANLNISIDLTKLPGSRVMDIEGRTCTKKCVVIPIDNIVGTVCDAYPSKNQDGTPTMKFFDDVKLNLVAIEYKQKKYGISHGLKPSYSSEHLQKMTEEQVYDAPWMGTVKPWNLPAEKKSDDIGDLPESDNDKNW